MIKRKLKSTAIPEVKPEGWLKDQLKIQMDGLTGKLYDVWDSVGSYSGWLGRVSKPVCSSSSVGTWLRIVPL